MENKDYNADDASEQNLTKEKMSKKTLKVWLSKNPPATNGEYVGELFIDKDQFVAKGETDGDSKWLYHQLENIWSPQLGVPVWKKEKDKFVENDKGQYIIEKYVNHGNCSADELLEAVYDYIRSMGVLKVELIDK